MANAAHAAHEQPMTPSNLLAPSTVSAALISGMAGGCAQAGHGRASEHGGFEDQIAIVSHMGVSENSVPLNPMVNDHYPY
jgi:hypothetical protein